MALEVEGEIIKILTKMRTTGIKTTSKESKKVPSRIKMRTDSERRAFSYLPDSIKDSCWRNRRVRFAKCHVFYPDILLLEAKIAIEIDGDIHQKERVQKKDRRKDREFTAHGYAIIRFSNEETENETLFLNKLHYELIKIDDLKNRRNGQKYVKAIEDVLYATEDEEYLIDESELSTYGLNIQIGSV